MGAFASRGQARTLALSLRLAEAEVLAAVRFEGPIVLLDDALSEIDRSRRHRVLEKASQYQQVLITTTDLDQVSGYFGAKAAYHQVDGGTVTPYDLESHGGERSWRYRRLPLRMRGNRPTPRTSSLALPLARGRGH